MSQLALAPSLVNACLVHCHFLLLAVLLFFVCVFTGQIFSWTIAGGGQPKTDCQLLADSRILCSFVCFVQNQTRSSVWVIVLIKVFKMVQFPGPHMLRNL